MKNMFIPPLGSKVTLAKDWQFTLYNECRNKTLWEKARGGYNPTWEARNNAEIFTLPAGFELTIVRIYIRQNQPDYNSVTFTCPYNGKKVRFWVKLSDVNKMLIEDPSEENE